jgi:hypothetical protein
MLPRRFKTLRIRLGSVGDMAPFMGQLNDRSLETGKVYLLEGLDQRGIIVAGNVGWHEDDAESFERSHFDVPPDVRLVTQHAGGQAARAKSPKLS